MDQEKRIAVLGAGTMGAGIAAQFALYGHKVSLYSRSQGTLDRAKKTIEKAYELLSQTSGLSPLDSETSLKRIFFTTDLTEAVAETWYVVESIVERAPDKAELYQTLNGLLGEDVILSSNTSYLNIFELIPAHRQTHTLIAHWYAPAHILPLVEIVKGPNTHPDVVEQMLSLHRSCGKTPVLMERYVPGFIVNRLQSAMTREVLFLLENGYCTPEDLDLAVKASLMPRGLALGVVQRMDFNGLDMIANGLRNGAYQPAPAPSTDNLVFRHTQAGNLGVKSGNGFYAYSVRPYEDTLKLRDAQLMKSVELAKEFAEHPLHDHT